MTNRDEKYGLALAALISEIGRINSNHSTDVSLADSALDFFTKFISKKESVKPFKEYIVRLLSSNSDIIKESEIISSEAEKIDSTSKTSYPLISILSRIDFLDSNKHLPDEKYYYLPGELNIYNIFPVKIENIIDKNEFEKQLSKTFHDFCEGINHLPDNELSAFIDSFLYLMEKHLVYIGGGQNNTVSDVSLFDNAKSLAALSLCKKYSQENEKYLIITADISGIQQFIYSEIGPKDGDESKAKRLRGKSFFLSLLTDLFSNYLLRMLDLPRTNLLMNGGGHFIIIAPNTSDNNAIIHDSEILIQKWFYNNFKGNLNLVIGTLTADDDLYKDFPKWYDKISSTLVKSKKQKSLNNIEKIFSYDLDSMDLSDFKQILSQKEIDKIADKDTEYEKNLSILAYLFEKIGEVLPKTKFILQSNIYPKYISGEKEFRGLSIIPFGTFDSYFCFIESEQALNSFLRKHSELDSAFIQILNINNTLLKFSEESLQIFSNKNHLSVGFKFMGNNAPMENKEIMTFEKLSTRNNEIKDKDETLSYVLAATLRMDVDNLGTIFSQGFDRKNKAENIRTLSRTVALSRQFNLFFGGYLNKIAERWNIYITYSGGDDLFVVGSWINIIGFALQVKKDFTRFACDNPYITISGGIYLHKTSFPIGRAAQFAGEAESKAKNKKKDKNCISIFDREFGWTEFEDFLNYGKDLDRLVDKDDIKASQLHYLLQISNRMINDDGEIILDEYYNMISKIRYMLARKPREITFEKIKNMEKDKNSVPEKVVYLSKLVNGNDSIKYIENLIIPASYVILKHRDKNRPIENNKIKEN